MKTKKIKSLKEFKSIKDSGVSLIDFTAPWCAPCRQQEPIVAQVAKKFGGRAVVSEVNIEKNPKAAGMLSVRGIPTIVIFKNGREKARFVGLQTEKTLTEALEKQLN